MKRSNALFAANILATLYLLGTLCFPIFLFFGLPITVVGFIGDGKQKRLNQSFAAT